MKSKNIWVNILIFNFCVVAFLGFLLRSKILFSIPFLDYNRLLDAHFHFAFGGWVTLALVFLFIHEVLPSELNGRSAYKWMPIAILAASWLLLVSSPLPANSAGASICSTIFILVTYVCAGVLIPDIRKAAISRKVKLLAISSLVCLVLSSVGIFVLAYLFAVKSLNMYAYRDALYTYLHLQYNGFFTLAVFAILFHKLERKMTEASRQKAYQFAVMLTISTIPSLFLTYLWRDPNDIYRIIAICGSITLFLSFILLVRFGLSLIDVSKGLRPLIRNMGILSLSSFALKIFLQSFTLFPAVGNAVFGDRPVIIGFLHLVFLGFVTLFIMAWFAYNGFLDLKYGYTRFALVIFIMAVIFNEVVLMTQGLGAMFIISSKIFPWLLWCISIALFGGALLVGLARIKSATSESQ